MCNIISQLFTCCGHKQFQNIYQCDFYTSTIVATNSSCSSFPRVLPDRIPPREYSVSYRTSKHEGKEGKDLAAIAGKTDTASKAAKPPSSESETERRCPNLRRPSRPVGGFCGNCIRRRRLLRLHGGSGASSLSVGGRLGLGDLPALPRVVLDSEPAAASPAPNAAFCSVSVINEEEAEPEDGRTNVVNEEGRERGTLARGGRERERGMGSVSSSSDHASSTDSSATLIMGTPTVPAGLAGGGGQGFTQGRGQNIGVAI